MKSITCNLPDSIHKALQQRMVSNKESCDHLVSMALSQSVRGCAMNEMHVSLLETEEFLKADLTRDPQDDLTSAERNHKS